MKSKILFASCSLAAVVLAGCSLLERGAPPSRVEQALFTTITNVVEVPVLKTVTITETNRVTVIETNLVSGEVVTKINEVIVPKVVIVTVTNLVEVYDHQVSDTTRGRVQGVGAIVDTFVPGIGGMAAAGILAVLGGIAQWRSSRRGRSQDALTQEVETILEFIKQLPNGAAHKEAITSWLQNHQVEAGVAEHIMALIENRVDNPEAKGAATEIRNLMAAVQKATVNMPPPTPTVAE